MKLTYSLSIDDWVAFSLQYLETSTEGRRVRLNGLLLGGLFLLVGSAVAGLVSGVATSLVLGLLALVGWYFVWPRWLRLSQRSATELRHRESQNPCLNGRHQMELEADGLHATCDVTDTVTSWAGIDRVETSSTHGFVFLRNNSGYVIPREKVHEGDFAAFIAQLKNRLQD